MKSAQNADKNPLGSRPNQGHHQRAKQGPPKPIDLEVFNQGCREIEESGIDEPPREEGEKVCQAQRGDGENSEEKPADEQVENTENRRHHNGAAKAFDVKARQHSCGNPNGKRQN